MPYIKVNSNGKVTLGSMIRRSDSQIMYDGEIPQYDHLIMEDGVIIKDPDYLAIDLEEALTSARAERTLQFAAMDKYDKAVIVDDIAQSDEEKLLRNTFRESWLSITDNYTDCDVDITTLYPDIPDGIKYFL